MLNEKLACLLVLLDVVTYVTAGESTTEFMKTFWLSLSGLSSTLLVFISLWLYYWAWIDEMEEKDMKQREAEDIPSVSTAEPDEDAAETSTTNPSAVTAAVTAAAAVTQEEPMEVEVATNAVEVNVHAVESSSLNRQRREIIPPRPADVSGDLVGLMSSVVGKNLLSTSLPVIYNEPLSVLQRICETFEFSELLDAAAREEDTDTQMLNIAAFCVAMYARAGRTSKPFNPLLGETYEMDRTEDMGWKFISEQVSHNPPVSSYHCSGQGWTVWGEVRTSVNFTGPTLSILPEGVLHLHIHATGHQVVWSRVKTTVHGLLLGSPWVENSGDTLIVNQSTGSSVHLRFKPPGFFDKEYHKVFGAVRNATGEIVYAIRGNWTSFLEMSIVEQGQKPEYSELLERILQGKEPADSADWRELWSSEETGSTLPAIFFHFTKFTCQLNQPEMGVAPTDSRNRADQRLLENGHIQLADQTKLELEQKQRERGMNDSSVWFHKVWDVTEGCFVHQFKGDYWQRKEEGKWDVTIKE